MKGCGEGRLTTYMWEKIHMATIVGGLEAFIHIAFVYAL